jgi:hypothetical protein
MRIQVVRIYQRRRDDDVVCASIDLEFPVCHCLSWFSK